ncbi:GTPase [Oscillatoriales cyanobacterium USR001]|nr:GTPase [Oscillatoriales cyanobacterium USR001]
MGTPETSSPRPHQPGELHLSLARASLRQALARHSPFGNPQQTANTELQAELQTQLDVLNSTLEKLDRNVIRIAAFGLVSRGKSAVLNAILGQKILQTGPLNGVTKWPRSVPWTTSQTLIGKDEIQVELIDTPGLDEVGGDARGEMAKQVTRQADLILFVVAGDITKTEYEALQELQKSQKPLILVFNKIDLYPEVDRQAIYQNLQALRNEEKDNIKRENINYKSLEIVMTAAEPTAIQVRVELPDGSITYEWESPPPQVDELRQKIITIINQEGQSILALNALTQAREAEANIAHKTIKLRQAEAENLIWQFAKYKALAVGLNPVAFLDIMGASMADLVLIRSLSKLYGLPMTGYEAGKLWKTIMFSASGLLLGEFGSSLMLGLGKSAAGMIADFSTFAGVTVTQASLAAYGTYAVGRASQVYLEKGCTWGPLGQDKIIQDIINQVERNSIIYRLQYNLRS